MKKATQKYRAILITAFVSVLFVSLFVCGFALLSGKKESSDNMTAESVTYDTEPTSADSSSQHAFRLGTADEQISDYDKSNAIDESVTFDPIIEESITVVPSDDIIEDDSTPHSYTPDSP